MSKPALTASRRENWRDAVSAGFDIYIEAFRSEPGFGSLRGGDVIDLRPAITPTTFNSHIAAVMVQTLADRFGTDRSDATQFAFENAVEVMDALVARAFARDPHGDGAFLDRGRALVLSIVSERLG